MRLSDAVIDEINNIKGFKTTSGELILEEKAELITKIVNRLLHEVTADPDTVSKQAVIENVCTMLRNCFDASDEMIEFVKITVGEMPPFTEQTASRDDTRFINKQI